MPGAQFSSTGEGVSNTALEADTGTGVTVSGRWGLDKYSVGSNRCFAAMRARFYKLYRVRAHLHHYTKFVEEGDVAEALEGFDRMVSAYAGARTSGDINGVSSAAMLKPMF